MGQKNGFHKLTLDNGVLFEGEVKDDYPNGKCKVTYPNGLIFEGNYSHGEPCGYGKMTFPHGKVYEGEWQNGKRHGYGKEVDMYGLICYSKWEHGKEITGECKYVRRINQDDFKLDMSHLTEKIPIYKNFDENKQHYELILEGKINKTKTIIQGKMSIEGIFTYTGTWQKSRLNGKGTLIDFVNKTFIDLEYSKGVKIEPETIKKDQSELNKSINQNEVQKDP